MPDPSGISTPPAASNFRSRSIVHVIDPPPRSRPFSIASSGGWGTLSYRPRLRTVVGEVRSLARMRNGHGGWGARVYIALGLSYLVVLSLLVSVLLTMAH
jgi:hypothetical protein